MRLSRNALPGSAAALASSKESVTPAPGWGERGCPFWAHTQSHSLSRSHGWARHRGHGGGRAAFQQAQPFGELSLGSRSRVRHGRHCWQQPRPAQRPAAREQRRDRAVTFCTGKATACPALGHKQLSLPLPPGPARSMAQQHQLPSSASPAFTLGAQPLAGSAS